MEKNKGAKTSSSKKMLYSKEKKNKPVPILPPIPRGANKVVALLEQWIKDNVIPLPKVEFLPSTRDQKDSRYYLYRRRKGHMLEQMLHF